MMRPSVALIAAGLLAAGLTSHAQQTPVRYKVEFNVHDSSEAADKADTRFALIVEGWQKGLLQVASRVPVPQQEAIEVGTNIACSVHESSGKAALEASIELSSVTGWVNLGSLAEPIIKQRKVAFHALLDSGTPTAVGGSPADLQVQATVTRMN